MAEQGSYAAKYRTQGDTDMAPHQITLHEILTNPNTLEGLAILAAYFACSATLFGVILTRKVKETPCKTVKITSRNSSKQRK